MFVEKQRLGLSTEYIYRTFIEPRYHISRTTLYNWLTIPYAAQLREIERQEQSTQNNLREQREPTT